MTLKQKIAEMEEQVAKYREMVKVSANHLLSDMSDYYKEFEADKVYNATIRINTLTHAISKLKDNRRKQW